MKWFVFVASIAAAFLYFAYVLMRNGDVPKAGQTAPSFNLLDQNNKSHSLSDYRGKWLVLYFYPKDDTIVCTREACSFRDDFSSIKAMGAEVLGVSVDNQTSHAKFAEKNKLPFSLLADPTGEVSERYGVLMTIMMFKLAKRYTFIIDPEGRVAKVYDKVEATIHSKEIISDLDKLRTK